MVKPPTHPVSQLQGPFEESMLESVVDDTDMDIFLDPVARRNTLLEAATYTRLVAGRWRQKPGEKYHPLWKLIAQISFGIHLLAEGMAKSEDEVMQILQSHVDEIDGFLERTTEDFDLAQEDIQERLRCLKLPLSHPATFDKMLEDRNFRLSIVNGNEKIEHIAERTSQAMKDSLKDVQKGFDSTSCLETYLQRLAQTWVRQSVEHEAVFVAMLGNVEGWRKAFMSLHVQGSKLGGLLKKLTDIINEMQKRAGEVSRRLLHQARGFPSPADPRVQQHQAMGRPTGRSTPTSRFAPNKDLPGMPARPPLRQVTSHDSVRTASSARTASNEALQYPRILSRSGTPQHGMPSPRNANMSPKVVQMGQTAQVRVQSMVPSLFETRPSPQTTPTTTKPDPLDEEQESERYFPPVELPAHVPEETMSKAPMSKQNRLSMGLGLNSTNRVEKRNSRLSSPASALVDLLRSNPISSKLSTAASTPKYARSPVTSRRASTSKSPATAEDNMSTSKTVSSASPSTGQKSSTRSPSIDDPTTSLHTKNNLRRPKKGAKHWFDALDDDLLDDDKFSIQEDTSPQVTTLSIHAPKQPPSDHGSIPGTPSWAATKFPRAEIKREELKKGAFSSHPPDLPPGSPPLAQDDMPDPLTVAPPQRRPSHASSAGTLGEPGPEIAASSFGGSSSHLLTVNDGRAWKRASTVAPEVVAVQKSATVPFVAKQFIAEMEGSTPPAVRSQTGPPSMVMELEAPQQYFKLPPRPQAPVRMPSKSEKPNEMPLAEPLEDQIVLPLGMQHGRKPSLGSAEIQSSELDAAQAKQEDYQTSEAQAGKSNNTNNTIEVVESAPEVVDIVETQILLPATTYIPTPQIPLPPSPLEGEDLRNSIIEDYSQEETLVRGESLYLLPAVAYKAPISPTSPTASPQLAPNLILPPEGVPLSPPLQAEEKPSTPTITTTQPQSALSKLEISVSNELSRDTQPAPAKRMQRDHRPEDLGHARNKSSHGSQNGWKAFFTGQPSPVGSNLSIRSIRCESADDLSLADQKSPTLLSPTSATNRFPPSPIAGNAKDVVWFNKAFEEGTDKGKVVVSEQTKNMSSPLGLGIQSVSVE